MHWLHHATVWSPVLLLALGTVHGANSVSAPAPIGTAVVNINRRPPTALYGVAPEDRALYESDGSRTGFKCRDGAKTIPFDKVNDDYCDCPDGSDEPGTAACARGQFYCANAGHRPARIRAAQVNDGVCDSACCDGSDEYSGLVTCPDRCAEEAAKSAAQEREQQAEQRRLSDLHRGYIERGTKAQQERDAEYAALLARRAEQQAEVDRLQHITALIRERQEYSEAERAFRAQPGTALGQKVHQVVPGLLAIVDALTGDLTYLLESLRTLRADHNPNYHDMAVKRTIENLEAFLAANPHYDVDSDDNQATSPGTIPFEHQRQAVRDRVQDLIDLAHTVEDFEAERADTPLVAKTDQVQALGITVAYGDLKDHVRGAYNWLAASVRPPPKDELAEGLYMDDLDAYQQQLDDARTTVEGIQGNLTALEGHQGIDYGPHGEFGPVTDECYSMDVSSFTYKICLFGSVTQRDKNAYHVVSLGDFAHWGVTTNDPKDPKFYAEQLYSDGQQCWDGPKRSAKVFFSCGPDNRLVEVSEPAKCEYQLKMQTPAMCPLLDDDEPAPESLAGKAPHDHDEL
ncbi:hypothetical protein IWQ60_010056 [Tieghemiomyces parasiticus]|uniref:Glucosidase 2 subunit beta n=1 Tax=Tieghemiomyces parasiticus TaxID=78921 RepID=A0A9W7ZRZ0_9FUNG|nr:hypothetical protein IWQ60_010056 [Tieghemiomyces parasiticus]